MKKNNLTKYLIVLILFIFSGMGLVYGLNTISTGYQIVNSEKTIDAWGTCKRVASTTSGKYYFAPTKTSAEWSAFINNKPTDVTLNACYINNLFIQTSNDTIFCDYALSYCTLLTYPSAYDKGPVAVGTACTQDYLYMESLAKPYVTNSDCGDISSSTECRIGVTVYKQKCIGGVIPAVIYY